MEAVDNYYANGYLVHNSDNEKLAEDDGGAPQE
jgi:hypothetical protein